MSIRIRLSTVTGVLIVSGLLLFPALPAHAQCAGDDDFEAYPPSSPIHGQGGWKGFDNNPGNSANVSSGVEPANSPTQSLIVENTSNVVRESNCLGEGHVRVSIFQYIQTPFNAGIPLEPDPGSIYRLFTDYVDSGPQFVGGQIRFDPGDGQAKVSFGNGTSTIDVPYLVDQWVPIDVVVNLENDYTVVFYDQTPVAEYQWTAGIAGGGAGSFNIAAVDLFANGSSPVFYDDLFIQAIPKFEDNFDAYANGSDIHGQGNWKGFDNNPSEGADVTQDQSLSLPQSLEIKGTDRPVHETDTFESGIWRFQAWQYIPSDFLSLGGIETEAGSIFRLHSVYSDGGTKETSAECRIDSTLGNLECFQGAGSAVVVVPYDTDRWVKIQVLVDLEDDWTQIYYDDDLVTEYTWTGGITGSGGGALDIAGVELRGNGATKLYYDDLDLTPGCGLGLTSDFDNDGRSAEQELQEGTDSCKQDSVPGLGPVGMGVLVVAISVAGVVIARRGRFSS